MEIIGSQLIAQTGLLTRREAEAALWIAEGKTQEEAAIILGCTSRTVRAHVANAMEKLSASTAAGFVSKLWLSGVVKPSRSAAAALLAFLVLFGAIHNVDQARLRPTRGGRVASRVARRDDALDLDMLGINWA